MEKFITSFVGLDVHKDSIAIGVATAGREAPHFVGTVAPQWAGSAACGRLRRSRAERTSKPSRRTSLKRLDVFIGNWHAEGTSYGDGQDAADPRAAGVPWTSDESYEWLPGSFFVLHRWDAQMGKHEFKGAEIMGCDEAEGSYFTRMFDNAGHHPDYAADVDGDVWSFKAAQTRATVKVQDAGDKMTFNWEWKNGGKKWLPLCDRVAVRTRRAKKR
jgi:hypothetical protein